MAHPFFDAMEYPWDRPEARAYRDVLLKAIKEPKQIGQLYRECAADLPALNLDQSPERIWVDALNMLTTANRLKELIERIEERKVFANNPVYKEAVEKIRNAKEVVSPSLKEPESEPDPAHSMTRKPEKVDPPQLPVVRRWVMWKLVELAGWVLRNANRMRTSGR